LFDLVMNDGPSTGLTNWNYKHLKQNVKKNIWS